jgi:ribonuclease T1
MFENKNKYILGLLLTFIVGWGMSYFVHTKDIKIEDRFEKTEQNTEISHSDNSYESKSEHTTFEENKPEKAHSFQESQNKNKHFSSRNNETYQENQDIPSGKAPDYAMEVLAFVEEHHDAPQGFVGGRTFQNREQILPKINSKGLKINYQEWDVHKKEAGKNRGAERLVTSDDHHAYYTSNHYKSFIKIK